MRGNEKSALGPHREGGDSPWSSSWDGNFRRNPQVRLMRYSDAMVELMKQVVRIVPFIVLIALAPSSLAEKTEAPDTVPSFTLEDQFQKSHTFEFPRAKPLVFSIADPGGAKDAPQWTKAVKEKYGKRIDFWSMANLTFIPSAAHGVARAGIRATSKDPVLCDWDGEVSAHLKSQKGKANIIVVSVTGEIQHRVSGKVEDEKLDKLYAIIDAALKETEAE